VDSVHELEEPQEFLVTDDAAGSIDVLWSHTCTRLLIQDPAQMARGRPLGESDRGKPFCLVAGVTSVTSSTVSYLGGERIRRHGLTDQEVSHEQL